MAGAEQGAPAGKVEDAVTGGPLRYTVDLMHLQSVCERNYWRLKKMLPSLDAREHFHFQWSQPGQGQEQADLVIEVLERGPYTDVLRLVQTISRLPWCSRMDMQLRLYHDAGMAEVLSFQSARRILARNRYPNPAMHARDEKTQINEFLAECLEHCLRHGHVADSWPGATLLAGT